MKRYAIIGRGTAGAISAAFMAARYPQAEITWYYDENIKPQAVGEGSTLSFPRFLQSHIRFWHQDLEQIDGTFKHGIRKLNWGKSNPDFFHPFAPPQVSYHFNALKLQSFLADRIKKQVRSIPGHITADQIDADFIIDCSGKPDHYDDFVLTPYIPVNSVYVTQCYWDQPTFEYTLAIARPYGWVFGIPLKHRCSIGYMYNQHVNSLDDVKEDVKNIFPEYNLTPSDHTNAFSFKNYYRKNNFTKRIAYNGNASFFLEPLEATSIGFMLTILQDATTIIDNNVHEDIPNWRYSKRVKEIERLINFHYFAGSTFNTPFWDSAQSQATQCLEEAFHDSNFVKFILASEGYDYQQPDQSYLEKFNYNFNNEYSHEWPLLSWNVNLSRHGLDLYPNIKKLWGFV